jgi:hypothetical protein
LRQLVILREQLVFMWEQFVVVQQLLLTGGLNCNRLNSDATSASAAEGSVADGAAGHMCMGGAGSFG